MKILRSSFILGVVFLMIASSGSWALSYEEVQKNYALSYKAEYELNYAEAIKPILAMLNSYGAQKYHFNLRLGWLNYLSQNYKDAVAYYKQAIAIEPGSIDARLGIILPLMAAENWVEAIKAGTAALRVDANNYYVNSRLAYCYFSNADYANAEKFYQKVLELYPTDLEMQLGLAWTCLKEAKKNAAEKLFKTVLLRSPDNQSALAGLNSLK